jgi:DNA gyrase/topoisomerase IV subunit A
VSGFLDSIVAALGGAQEDDPRLDKGARQGFQYNVPGSEQYLQRRMQRAERLGRKGKMWESAELATENSEMQDFLEKQKALQALLAQEREGYQRGPR